MKTTCPHFRKGRVRFHSLPHRYLLSAYYVKGATRARVVRSSGSLERIQSSSFPPVLGAAGLCAGAQGQASGCLGVRRWARSWPVGTLPLLENKTKPNLRNSAFSMFCVLDSKWDFVWIKSSMVKNKLEPSGLVYLLFFLMSIFEGRG